MSAILRANDNGIIEGKFTIPNGIPAGSKRIEFLGEGGSKGDAIFTGVGEITTETKQSITRVTETRWQVDPLAQTFTLTENISLAGVDLWFTRNAKKTVLVQIRDTAVGMPTKTIRCEKRLNSEQISTNGIHTRVLFDTPVSLEANTEYALVILTDDPDASLAVAELGKFDNHLRQWVSAQAYQVGVLLSSSNAVTWTAHQEKDLTFRLLKSRFSTTEKEIDLGNVNVENATDLMLIALTDSPNAEARVEFLLTLPDDEATKINVASEQPIRLIKPVTGEVNVKATLIGNANHSPILFPDVQLISGQLNNEAVYYTRAIPSGDNTRLKVIFDAQLPAGSSVKVEAIGVDDDDQPQTVEFSKSTPVDDGFIEMTYELENFSERMARVKLTLSGNTAARPRVKNLRVMTF